MHKKLLNFLILMVIFWGTRAVDWTGELIHKGGAATAKQLFSAMTAPTITPDILQLIIKSSWQTISYAVAGMSISLIIAFILGLLASGILAGDTLSSHLLIKVTRALLSFMRSIHELVWAWLFVAAFGLHPLSAILALAIPYGGTLGRIFADMLTDVPKAPILAIRNTGAGKLQTLFYVYFPYALPNMVSYSLYRFECAIRASTIMSFVGLGGLGYQIQLALNDLEYSDAFAFLYALILLVVLIDIWSSHLRSSMQNQSHVKWNVVNLSLHFSFLITVMSWMSIHFSEGIYFRDVFNDKNWAFTLKFLRGLAGIGEVIPGFLDPDKWLQAFKLSLETLQMSLLAITLAAIFALLCAIPGARGHVVNNTEASGYIKRWIYLLMRGLFIATRAIPELIWAMFFVFMFKPGPLPGILALAVHNFGILGKLCAEVVENMDKRPLIALKTSGAGTLQTLVYGVLPLTVPKFITYILYRWEVIIRTTIIVGFVGAGGLGQAFRLSMSWFHYSDITLYLICYLILIGGVDLLAQYFRKQFK